MLVRRQVLFSRISVAAFVVVLRTSLLFSQDVSVTTNVDSSHITVGDWLNLTVQVKHDPSVGLSWAAPHDTLGPFAIIKMDTLEPEQSNGSVVEGRKFILSAYDSGSFVIPPILVAYKTPNDTTTHYVQSDSHTVQVSTIDVDTSKAIKDIKPPVGVPMTWKEILFYVAIALAVAALIYLAYYYYKKKKNKSPEIIEEARPAVPAHVQAIIQLKELQEKRVWQQGDVKGFYSQTTEIIRQYFEGRYGITALEMTSDEVFSQLKRFQLAPEITRSIESLFINSDLVKFAKYLPTPSENEAVIPQALDIVERTKPHEEVPVNV